MKSALVLGAGVAGCTAAYLLAKSGFRVTVLEGLPHPGGGVWTNFYAGHPYTFGPRVFFTRDEPVIAHLTDLIDIRVFNPRTRTFVESDARLYHYPLQFSDLPFMPEYGQIQVELAGRKKKISSVENFEAYWLDAIGPTLYNKFVNSYSKKMWGVESNRQLTTSFDWVNRGTPIRDGDDRLYTDQFQGYPSDCRGYNDYFEKCLADSRVYFNCTIKGFDSEKRHVHSIYGDFTGDVIVSSIYVDELFNFQYGQLSFRGRQCIPLWLPVENAFPEDVTWIHYSGDEEHTRVTEFKRITGFKSSSTLLGIEIPAPRGRCYPVPTPPELTRFELYKTLFPSDFFSIGRPGKFQYQGISDGIRDAIDVVQALK